MSQVKGPLHISNAELKAGVFLTFCLALFIAMLFFLGHFGRSWRGRQQLKVAFTHISALRQDAPVLYNGMDIGTVFKIEIARLTAPILEKFPPIAPSDLPNLPLTDAEREEFLRADAQQLDAQVRARIQDRTMVLLVLDVLAEHDAQRYRIDDEFRITGSLMGDSAVEIRTGAGDALPTQYDKYLLGTGGDMYTDLGKSIGQVKDILGSMAEMVGGDDSRSTVSGQLENFDAFTRRLDEMSASLETNLDGNWDSLDQRMVGVQNLLNDVEKKVVGAKPELDKTLENAQNSVAAIQKDTLEVLQSFDDKIKSMRQDVLKSIAEWQQKVTAYKASIPEQVASARQWTQKLEPTLEKFEALFQRADDSLNKGTETTRASLREYVSLSAGIEETSYRMWKWPYGYANRPTEDVARKRDLLWRHDLAQTCYRELRNELEFVRQNLSATDSVRISRIEQLIREIDSALEVRPTVTEPEPAKPPKGKGK